MKRVFSILLTLYVSTMLFAGKIKIGDICYDISQYSDLATVVHESSLNFSSDNYSDLIEANIPATITYNGKTYNVVAIEDYAFYQCENLISVTIPHTIKRIGDRAFYGSPILSVHIDDITAWCEITYGININHEVSNPLQYGADLYLNDELISDLVIPNNLTSIGRRL